MTDSTNSDDQEFNPAAWHPDGDPFLHAGSHAIRLSKSENPIAVELAYRLGGALNGLREAGNDPEKVARAAYWVGLLSGYLAEEEAYPSKDRLGAAEAYLTRCDQKLALQKRNNNEDVLRSRAVRSIAQDYALSLLIDDYFGGARKLRRATLAKMVYDMLAHSALVGHRPTLRTVNEKWLAELAKAFYYISEPGAPKTPTKN
jgi:hypothetical protein